MTRIYVVPFIRPTRTIRKANLSGDTKNASRGNEPETIQGVTVAFSSLMGAREGRRAELRNSRMRVSAARLNTMAASAKVATPQGMRTARRASGGQ
jgi:hypothetical protein